jgi:hypothetical protein
MRPSKQQRARLVHQLRSAAKHEFPARSHLSGPAAAAQLRLDARAATCTHIRSRRSRSPRPSSYPASPGGCPRLGARGRRLRRSLRRASVEREGRLAITEPPGGVVISVADPDEPPAGLQVAGREFNGAPSRAGRRRSTTAFWSPSRCSRRRALLARLRCVGTSGPLSPAVANCCQVRLSRKWVRKA